MTLNEIMVEIHKRLKELKNVNTTEAYDERFILDSFIDCYDILSKSIEEQER